MILDSTKRLWTSLINTCLLELRQGRCSQTTYLARSLRFTRSMRLSLQDSALNMKSITAQCCLALPLLSIRGSFWHAHLTRQWGSMIFMTKKLWHNSSQLTASTSTASLGPHLDRQFSLVCLTWVLCSFTISLGQSKDLSRQSNLKVTSLFL